MTEQEVIAKLGRKLNEEGAAYGITFQVSENWRPDGEWTQFFVTIQDGGKRAAAAQILADVEEEISNDWGRELLVVQTAA